MAAARKRPSKWARVLVAASALVESMWACVAQSNPVEVSTSLDDEPIQEIEPVDEAVDETVSVRQSPLDNEPDEKSEPVDVSANLDNEAAKESKCTDSVHVDLSVNPISQPRL
jgi:hypothetical protein